MAWDVDLVLALVDPETGRFRVRRGLLRSMVAAGTIAEAAYTGQLVQTRDRVRGAVSADALVQLPEEATTKRADDLDDRDTRPDALADQEHHAGAHLPSAPARKLGWPAAPVRTSRLIRRIRKSALRETLECAQAERALREAPRQRLRGARYLVADPVRRELLLEQLANVGQKGDAQRGRDHTLLALAVAAGRLHVIAPNADRLGRARLRHLAVSSWAAQALRRSLGLDPLRDKRDSLRARRRRDRPERQPEP